MHPNHRKGNYYYIVNLANDLVLSMPETQRYLKDSVMIQELQPQSIRQVWMIEQVQPNLYEIVHAISTLVVESHNGGNCKLQFGKQKGSQIFRLKAIDNDENRIKIWFTEKNKSMKHLYWSNSGLKFRQMDFNDKGCQWELLPIKKNEFISKTCYISSFSSFHCLDVPEASQKLQTQIIQYPCNYRFNQKWMLKKANQFSYYIMNAKSKLYLDIKQQSHKEGTPIIQYTYNGHKNQQWRLQQQGKHVYLIRSMMDNELLLSVKENSLKEGAQIVTSKYEVGSFWLITGFIPT